MNSDNNNRKTTRKKKKKKRKTRRKFRDVKNTDKNCPKKKPWNTEIRLEKKKDVQNFVFRKKHKVSRNKNMFGSIYKKKTEPKFGGYFISYEYGLLRCFHKWAVSKRKKKEKNTKPRIIHIWCPREIIRNKKTREKKNGTKKKTVSRKKKDIQIFISRNPKCQETQVSRNAKCQETQCVK